jgi:hypothetical protein
MAMSSAQIADINVTARFTRHVGGRRKILDRRVRVATTRK